MRKLHSRMTDATDNKQIYYFDSQYGRLGDVVYTKIEITNNEGCNMKIMSSYDRFFDDVTAVNLERLIEQ